ncbi:type II secretion system protein G [Rubritalea squalenifaciens DSM 18772]|uniref:Type II secretion system protein G n=1 Tax=Rubritalea squalenifaciens DSM 18772 TaxID=1123071 RepID=A0A1M6S723_9BACT|nr:type II secretion system protein GspG [Rubritalea squalenifaciens]SHK40562.1 type II secretion system protein G [Rubritalea squalenifaciens DSM 18772]
MYRRFFTLLYLLPLPPLLLLVGCSEPTGPHDYPNEHALASFAGIMYYQQLTGEIPTTEQGLQALVERPAELPKNRPWFSMLKEVPTDPWRNPYQYTAFPDEDPPRVVIHCLGRDGIESEDDRVFEQTFPKPKHPGRIYAGRSHALGSDVLHDDSWKLTLIGEKFSLHIRSHDGREQHSRGRVIYHDQNEADYAFSLLPEEAGSIVFPYPYSEENGLKDIGYPIQLSETEMVFGCCGTLSDEDFHITLER